MKRINTSLKKKNKEDLKIIFEPFPGIDNENLTKNKNRKKKNILLLIFVIIVLVLLFVFSSVLNMKFLYKNDQGSKYNVENKFNSNYATIKREKREALFKKIGFDYSKNKVENLKDTKYDVTYAYKTLPGYGNLTDSINVFYDKKGAVKYIMLNLVYKVNQLDISKIALDCNNVLNNFIKTDTTEEDIKKVLNDGYYYLNDDKVGVGLFYRMTRQNEKYYNLIITIEKQEV